MRRKIKPTDVMRLVEELATAKPNDLVKIALLEGEFISIDSLDLKLLSEIKRGTNGVVEIKLLNRLDAVELLAKLVSDAEAKQTKTPLAENFYKAFDEAAGRIKETVDD